MELKMYARERAERRREWRNIGKGIAITMGISILMYGLLGGLVFLMGLAE